MDYFNSLFYGLFIINKIDFKIKNFFSLFFIIYMTNYFYNLPYELQLLCYRFSNKSVIHNLRKKNHAASIIQTAWYKIILYRYRILPSRQNATTTIH